MAETLIEAEFSGNQWRIRASEINRLLKEGVPDVPAAGGDEEMAPSGNGSARYRVNGVRDRDADPHRAAGKERDLIEAYAGAARKQAKLEEANSIGGCWNWMTASVSVKTKYKPGTGNASPKCNTRIGCAP